MPEKGYEKEATPRSNTAAERSRREAFAAERVESQRLGEKMLLECQRIVDSSKYDQNDQESRLVELCVDYIEAGADVDFVTHYGRDSCLLWCAVHGFSQVVDVLLNCKANPSLKDDEGSMSTS